MSNKKLSVAILVGAIVLAIMLFGPALHLLGWLLLVLIKSIIALAIVCVLTYLGLMAFTVLVWSFNTLFRKETSGFPFLTLESMNLFAIITEDTRDEC